MQFYLLHRRKLSPYQNNSKNKFKHDFYIQFGQFTCCGCVLAIMDFSCQEYAEMHFIYGYCNGNALAARREYEARYADRRIPSSSVFTGLHQRLVESGTVHKKPSEVGPVLHDVGVEELVLNIVRGNPETSTREVSREIGVSNWKVWDILHKDKMHPFHFTPVQALEETDFDRRVQFFADGC